MNGRFFLDTNVFVYSFDTRTPAKTHRALQLIRGAMETRVVGQSEIWGNVKNWSGRQIARHVGLCGIVRS
jgi:predicted nucleic acid-binding protein